MDEKKKAAAIKYDPKMHNAPVVVAKGFGELAQRIIKIAKENNIPIVEDKDLVSALIKVDVFEEIPPELYRAVAKVLVFVKGLRR